MCGILGFIDDSLTEDAGRQLLHSMTATQSHRGPDASGEYLQSPCFLGHNRLSIIDLSVAANQPMQRGSNWLTFNGEIYNYIEIRNDLKLLGHVFRTQSDSEVILASFEQWGPDCVSHFVGMWALAIWNEERRELFCSRDRFGIKPFHYIRRGNRFYFASEIKTVKHSPLFTNDVNFNQVDRGLHLGWMHYHDETYFNCVKSLPAGHNLMISHGDVKCWKYYELDTKSESTRSFEENCHFFHELFFDSIRLHRRSDVTLGVCLSGGLDSSAIAGALSAISGGEQLKTFSAYYTGDDAVDERPFISEVLKQYPNIEPFYISPSEIDVTEAFERVQYQMDIPLPSSSYVSHYFVMKLVAEQNVKVVLDGQGSDEMLGGYGHAFYRVLADALRHGHVRDFARQIVRASSRNKFSLSKNLSVVRNAILSSFMSESQLYKSERRFNYPSVLKQDRSSFSLSSQGRNGFNCFSQNLMETTLLPTLLHTEDINSMAFSIESRVPFLDHRLVEFCFALPNDHKSLDGETKRVLRYGMKDVLPESISQRRDKKGFVTPGEVRWLRNNLHHLIAGDWSSLNDVVKVSKVKSLVREFEAGNNQHSLFIWRLATLRLWMKSCV